jgi:hypothetical protein
MDTLGALALATEPPTDHLMDQLPVGRRSIFFFQFLGFELGFLDHEYDIWLMCYFMQDQSEI